MPHEKKIKVTNHVLSLLIEYDMVSVFVVLKIREIPNSRNSSGEHIFDITIKFVHLDVQPRMVNISLENDLN